jgi:hypothetical protein
MGFTARKVLFPKQAFPFRPCMQPPLHGPLFDHHFDLRSRTPFACAILVDQSSHLRRVIRMLRGLIVQSHVARMKDIVGICFDFVEMPPFGCRQMAASSSWRPLGLRKHEEIFLVLPRRLECCCESCPPLLCDWGLSRLCSPPPRAAFHHKAQNPGGLRGSRFS